jgi:hypothetical protein
VTVLKTERFPVGATVAAYACLAKHLHNRPVGAPLATAVVAEDGSLTFDGLEPGKAYVAYLCAAPGDHRYVDFRFWPSGARAKAG